MRSSLRRHAVEAFAAWLRSFTLYQRGRKPTTRTSVGLNETPEPDEGVARRARGLGYALAVGSPLVTALALVGLRDTIDRSTAVLVLVLPVVLVAIVGGPRPAALASLVAPIGFDVLLVAPYHRLEIHAAADIEAALVLLVVGLLVGQLVAGEARHRIRAAARADELDALLGAVHGAVRADETELAAVVAGELRTLLDLRECRWKADYAGGAYPHLEPGGDVARHDVASGLGPLPRTGVELPVSFGRTTFGMFVLQPGGDASISREERLVASALADVMALSLAARRRPPDRRRQHRREAT
jgi:hypothetical protein